MSRQVVDWASSAEIRFASRQRVGMTLCQPSNQTFPKQNSSTKLPQVRYASWLVLRTGSGRLALRVGIYESD